MLNKKSPKMSLTLLSGSYFLTSFMTAGTQNTCRLFIHLVLSCFCNTSFLRPRAAYAFLRANSFPKMLWNKPKRTSFILTQNIERIPIITLFFPFNH